MAHQSSQIHYACYLKDDDESKIFKVTVPDLSYTDDIKQAILAARPRTLRDVEVTDMTLYYVNIREGTASLSGAEYLGIKMELYDQVPSSAGVGWLSMPKFKSTMDEGMVNIIVVVNRD